MLKSKRLWISAAVILALVLVAIVAVSLLINADAYRPRIQAALTQSLGRPVTLGHLGASILSGSLVATAPSIADDPAFSSQPFVQAKEIKIGVAMLPLILHHELHITGFTIESPTIVLIRAADGTWNYSSLGGKGHADAPATPSSENPLPNLTVNKIDVKDGTLELATRPATGPAREIENVNITLQNFSFNGPFQFTLSAKLPQDGSLDVKGNAGPIAEGDASLTPVSAMITMRDADLAAAGVLDAGSGLGGVADLDAKVTSNGQSAQLAGKLELTKLTLVKGGKPAGEPVDVDLQVSQDLKAMVGTVQQATARIGKAALNATGTYETQGNVTNMQIKIFGQAMPVEDIETLLPAVGVTLPAGSHLEGGFAGAQLAVGGPLSAPVVNGRVEVTNMRLTGFDLGSKLAAVAALTGTKTGDTTTVQVLSSSVHYGPDGIATNDIDALVTGVGSATGSGTISPDGALDYHMVVSLAGGAGALATKAVSLLTGAKGGGVPVKIGGTTSNPTFAPDLGAMVGGVGNAGKSATKGLGKALGGLLGR